MSILRNLFQDRFYFKKSFIVTAMALGLLTSSANMAEADDLVSIARGGRLYDTWWRENKAEKPTVTHPAYPGKNFKNDATWRCPECHGWDLLGKDGAYGEGNKHYTGLKGLKGAIDKDPTTIATILRDKTHGYTTAMLTNTDVSDLANFISKGQIDMAKFIEYPTLKSKGNVAKGKVYFETLCIGCHGKDGKKIADADPIGSVAANGDRMVMKIRHGQPREQMPALLALDPQVTIDIVAHLQTLPQ
ncbi:MAG: c-type cytochrome [Magnetococcales bacterium]|nr:c-type cytochrome [Magnetococcales bacterium]